MKKLIITQAIATLLLCGCVTIVPPRKDDDGSTTLKWEEASMIHPYTTPSPSLWYTNQKQLDFEYITAANIKAAVHNHNYTVVEVSASWCAHCWVNLSNLRKIHKLLGDRNSQLFFVWQNINVPVMQGQLFKADYKTRSYIIDPKSYGTDETQKQISFCRELVDNYPYNFSGSVPLVIILDKNGACKKVLGGEVSSDTLLRYTD